MFFFWHPKPVVDRRPVAEQSVQVRAATLPALIALAAPRSNTRQAFQSALPAELPAEADKRLAG